MPSLSVLKSKWFIDVKSSTNKLPPLARHKGSSISKYTDGNAVSIILEGSEYMKQWNENLVAVSGSPKGQVLHAAWVIEDVKTLGQSKPASGAVALLLEKIKKGTDVQLAICGQPGKARFYAKNLTHLTLLREAGVTGVAFDIRFPSGGTQHQKFTVFKSSSIALAMLGSGDLVNNRWDRGTHLRDDAERPTTIPPTHDIGVSIIGPAVQDIEISFRERWNDASRSDGLGWPLYITPIAFPPPSKIEGPLVAPSSSGSHSVQVLHTYGQVSFLLERYSWADLGEFTLWASYINAIKKASTYIYIEDQYFLPFGSPPWFQSNGSDLQAVDIIFQLGEAIKRGVRVAVVVPDKTEDLLSDYQTYQRDLGVSYLQNVASKSAGEFLISTLRGRDQKGEWPIYVHSKVMLCDDEFMLVGTANIGRRSMTHDSELAVGVVDAAEKLVKDLRIKLWSEHLQSASPGLDNPLSAFQIFKASVLSRQGRLRPYLNHNIEKRWFHSFWIDAVVDPYAGPDYD